MNVLPSNPTAAEKVRDLLRGFSTAMLVTHAPNGEVRARPMALASVTDACWAYFFTGEDTAKLHEIERNSDVHLICQNDHSSYLSIAGKATVLHEKERIKELWKESYRIWFPQGVDDPNIVLIWFRPMRAEYWDQTGTNTLTYMWEAVKAYVSGDRPDVDNPEQHGVVHLGEQGFR